MNTSVEVNNINGMHKRTSYIILLFMLIIILLIDASVSHFVLKTKGDWVLYLLILAMGLLSILLMRERYAFIEINQELLSIKQCTYLNSPKTPVIELPLYCIEHFKIEKIFFRNYIIIVRGERRKKIRYHLKGVSKKQIGDIREYFEILIYNRELKEV